MSFVNSLKNFIGMETDEDYYDDEEYMEDEEELEEQVLRRSHAKKPSRSSAQSNVVPINNIPTSRIRILKPDEFDDSTKIADEIVARRLVIFDVGNLATDDARRVVDFVSGVAYGLKGSIRRVSGGIFVAAPSNMDITGDNIKEQTRNSINWDI